MSERSVAPNLTPQFCFSSGALQEFLRLSRSSIDDPITQNLNALVTPARSGFDPSSTSHRTSSSHSKQIDLQSCQNFKDKVLFPSWQTRKDVLYYCGVVASSPDPDDPGATLREMEREKDKHRVVDERLDPYSGRFFPREARTEILASLIRQENQIESIVRNRTWATVEQRCGSTGQSWAQAAETWKRSHGSQGH